MKLFCSLKISGVSSEMFLHSYVFASSLSCSTSSDAKCSEVPECVEKYILNFYSIYNKFTGKTTFPLRPLPPDLFPFPQKDQQLSRKATVNGSCQGVRHATRETSSRLEMVLAQLKSFGRINQIFLEGGQEGYRKEGFAARKDFGGFLCVGLVQSGGD